MTRKYTKINKKRISKRSNNRNNKSKKLSKKIQKGGDEKKLEVSDNIENSLKTLGLIVVIILLFYFWDFTLNPIINIVLKSSLIICSYLYTVYKLKLSLDISHIFDKLLRF